MKISLVLPAHNEEENLQILVPKVLKKYKNEIQQVVIVNDNSTDGTRSVAESLMKKYGKKIKLINRKKPNGVGYAIKEGVQAVDASSDWILTMDSDFIRNVDDIEKFIRKAEEGYDGVIGSRFVKKNSFVNYPFMKMVANRSYHTLLKLVLQVRQKDLTNNFKMYRREVYQSLPLQAHNFSVNAETGLYPIAKGYNIAEVPVRWIQRDFGSSKFIVFKLAPSYLKIFWKVLMMKLK